MFGIARNMMLIDIEIRKRFVERLKKLVGKKVAIKFDTFYVLWTLTKISDNGQCVLFKEGKVSSVKSVSWVKDHFVDSFSK